jgi:hypothetical protein
LADSTRVMNGREVFIRNYDAWGHLEMFLVSAVAAVLSIRLFLQLTGYPRLGGYGLHIAHMLWGGLLMGVAIIILVSYIGKTTQRWAAIAGGLGFGIFIDEIGKFVTADNDYFFEPAVALMYVVFVLIFLATSVIHSRPRYAPKEYLMNALQKVEELVMQDLDAEEKREALALLRKCDPEDPIVASLTQLLGRADLGPRKPSGSLQRARRMARHTYRRLTSLPQFPSLIVWVFVGQLVFKLTYVAILVFFVGFGWREVPVSGWVHWFIGRIDALTFVEVAQLLSSLLSAVFVLVGVLRIRQSRVYAFQMFEQSLLVSIFLTQVFAFYVQQFTALIGLVLNIVLLVLTRFALRQELTAVGSVAFPGARTGAARGLRPS